MLLGLVPQMDKIVNEETHPNDADHWQTFFKNMRDIVNNGQPIASQAVTAADGITFQPSIQSSRIRVISATGGGITVTKNPQILAGNDGQEIMLEGSDDTRSVTLTNGNGLQTLGHANVELRNGDVVKFCYNSSRNLWIEESRSINR